MPVYPCPECGAQLRPANPVPAGKKLRCPKCEAVFAPAGKAKAPAKAAPAAAMAPAEETYGLSQQEEAHNPEAARNAFDPIKDRFKLSARGPALVLVVKPSTALLGTGCLICAMAIAGAMFAVWPMIFKIEDTKPPDKMAKFRGPEKNERHFKEMTPDDYTEHWWILAGSVFQFVWGAVVCAGASKMHALETYPLALIGSVMAFVGPFVPLGIWLMNYALTEDDHTWILPAVLMLGGSIPISFWCVSTLRNKKVIAGFQEEKPDEI